MLPEGRTIHSSSFKLKLSFVLFSELWEQPECQSLDKGATGEIHILDMQFLEISSQPCGCPM